MSHEAAEVQKHVKIYISVFCALAMLTVLTVGISYLHLSTIPAIILALIIASTKGSLVACYFMHLISEKKLILSVLILTAIFFVVLLLVPALADLDKVHVAYVS